MIQKCILYGYGEDYELWTWIEVKMSYSTRKHFFILHGLLSSICILH
jgi:hypothetical protein